jgi:hypothetical protein
MTPGEQPFDIWFIFFQPLGLKEWPLIPIDSEPFQSIQNRLDQIGIRSFFVGILNPHDEFAAVMPRKKPVKYGCPGSSNVKIP